MASIKTQNLVVLDAERNLYSSGSAAIVGNEYKANTTGGTGHTAHPVIEALGRVVWLSPDKRKGIFLSDTRGLVQYDLDMDVFDEVDINDERIKNTELKPDLITRVQFGPLYTGLTVLNRYGLVQVLKNTFADRKEWERIVCHCLHTVLRNNARIGCADFVLRSALSYVIDEIPIGTLDRDAAFFEQMGKFETKLTFFQNYVQHMRSSNPAFGEACYVDSTPLPNDAHNNPFNAFSSHGTEGLEKQTRLVLILDIATGRPVWFEFIQGNKLDHSTIESVCTELNVHLCTDVKGCVLDAGYACRELFERYNISNYKVHKEDGSEENRFMIVRMPEKPGYPYGDLYHETKGRLYDASHQFVREEHTYFGERITAPVNILGFPEYAYVYLDMQQAMALNQQYRTLNPNEWAAMTPEEKNYAAVKDGFFILLSNKPATPEQMLDDYLARVEIEHFFKDAKSYLDLLPLGKWTVERIKGKVLCDIISTILYKDFRKEAGRLQLTMPRLLTCLSGIDCTLDTGNSMLIVSTPNRQIREILEALNVYMPGHIKVDDFRKIVHDGYLLSDPSIKARSPKAGRPKGSGVKVPMSEEQKRAEREKRKAERAAKRAEQKISKELLKLADHAMTEADRVAECMAEGKPKIAIHAVKRVEADYEKALLLAAGMDP